MSGRSGVSARAERVALALVAAAVTIPVLAPVNAWWARPQTGLFLSGGGVPKAALVLALITCAVGTWAVSARSSRALRWGPLGWVALGLMAWTVVATVFSVSPGTALVGGWGTAQGAVWSLGCLLGLGCVVQLASSPSRVRLLLRAIGIAGGVAAAYGLLQAARLDPFDWGTLPWGAGRAFAMLGNPDMFGAYGAMTLGVTLALLFVERDERWRWAWRAVVPVVAAAVFASFSRGAWIGGVAGLGAFALSARGIGRKDMRELAAVAAVALVLIGLVAVAGRAGGSPDTDVAARVGGLVGAGDRNGDARLEIWSIGLAAIAERPVLGYGPDTFPLAAEPLRTRRLAGLQRPGTIQEAAHNVLVQTATDLGVVGLALWLALVVGASVTGLRFIRRGPAEAEQTRLGVAGAWAGCAAFLAAWLFAPGHPASVATFWVLVALALAPVARRVGLRAGAASAIAPAAIALAVLAACVAGAMTAADRAARVAVDRARPSSERLAAAARATRLNPVSAEFAAVSARARMDDVLGLIDEGTAMPGVVFDRYEAAVADAERAVALEPTNPQRLVLLGSLQLVGASEGDPLIYPDALATLARARALSPSALDATYWYARGLWETDRGDEAQDLLVEVLEIDPGYVSAATYLADRYLEAGEREAALGVLEACVAANPDPTALGALARMRAQAP